MCFTTPLPSKDTERGAEKSDEIGRPRSTLLAAIAAAWTSCRYHLGVDTVGHVHVSAGNVNRFKAHGPRFKFKDVTPVLELHKRHHERIKPWSSITMKGFSADTVISSIVRGTDAELVACTAEVYPDIVETAYPGGNSLRSRNPTVPGPEDQEVQELLVEIQQQPGVLVFRSPAVAITNVSRVVRAARTKQENNGKLKATEHDSK